MPPSTTRHCPVMYDDLWDARKWTASATSSAFPIFPREAVRMMFSTSSGFSVESSRFRSIQAPQHSL